MDETQQAGRPQATPNKQCCVELLVMFSLQDSTQVLLVITGQTASITTVCGVYLAVTKRLMESHVQDK